MKSVKALTKPGHSDSWFSWVIAISCMVVVSGTFGILRSSGVLFAEVIHAFHVNRKLASWPFAVSAMLNSFSGIVCGPLTTVIPVRLIVILSICGSALGLGICSITSSILWMTVGFGVFFGVGTGLVYVCLPMVINDYFKKNKSMGNGILLAGAPLGVIVFAPISEVFITTYALRGTFLLLSALCLQTLVFAALMKPAGRCNVRNNSKPCEEIAEETEDHALICDTKDTSIIPHSELENDLTDLEKSCKRDTNEFDVSVKSSLKSDSIEFDIIDNFGPTDFGHTSSNDYQETRASCQEVANVNKNVRSPYCKHIISSVSRDNVIQTDAVSDENRPRGRCLCFVKVLNLLKNPTFVLMTINYMLAMTAIQIVSNVLVDYAEDKGLSRESAVMLFTATSVAEFFSRVCSGWITDKGFVRKEYLLIISQVMTGATVCLISFVYGKIALCVLLVLFGIFTSNIIVLVNVFCADNFQKELLGFVFGIRHASMIITSLIRPWIIGIFRDNIGSYDYLFRLVGGITAISSFLWVLTFCNNKKKNSTDPSA